MISASLSQVFGGAIRVDLQLISYQPRKRRESRKSVDRISPREGIVLAKTHENFSV